MTVTNKPVSPVFREGDAVVLHKGAYEGTHGVFLRLREDPKWADIAESNGKVRHHPVEWLAHARGTGVSSLSADVLQQAEARGPDISSWPL